MGIYDRDYYREERQTFALRAPRSVTATLIIINVVVYLVDYLLLAGERNGQIAESLRVTVGSLTRP